jgi:hypothetical protein
MKRILSVKEKTAYRNMGSLKAAYRQGFSRGLALGLILLAAFIVLTGGLLYGQAGVDALFIDEKGTVKVQELEVKGATRLGDAVTVEGATTLKKNLTVNGNAGIGTTAPKAALDIQQEERTDLEKHPKSVKGLYVTGNFTADKGVEFRHSNGSSGIGFGYDTIYATGHNDDQDLNLKPRGTGHVSVQGNLNVDSETTLGKTLTVKGDIKMSGDLELSGQLKPNYDSGWFPVNINSKYEKPHELGALPIRVQMFFSPNSDGNPQYIVGMVNRNYHNGYNVEMTTKKFIIVTGNTNVCVYRSSEGKLSGKAQKSGWYRFLAWK